MTTRIRHRSGGQHSQLYQLLGWQLVAPSSTAIPRVVVRCELLAARSYGRFAQHRLDSPLGPSTGEVRETLFMIH